MTKYVGLALAMIVTLAAQTIMPLATAAEPALPEPRIAGGFKAAPGSWPSHVGIVLRNGPNTLRCSGSLIHSQWVLTSASCLHERNGDRVTASSLEVALGSQEFEKTRRISVVKSVQHPRWNRRTLEFDIALLKLARPTTNRQQVLSSIPVPAQARLVVTGWGDYNSDHYNSGQLNQVGLWNKADSWCSLQWGVIYRRQSMGCMADLGTSVHCPGDLGNPVLVWRSGRWVQVGVSSWSDGGCEKYGRPAAYAKLSSAAAWISQEVRR